MQPTGRAAAWAGLLLTALVLVQGAHVAEHVAQVWQRFGLGMKEAHGLAGALFDREVVHFAYNTALAAGLVAATLGLSAAARWRDDRAAWAALLLAATGLQLYHAAEHVLKLEQFLATGHNDTPGLVGMFAPGILVHFALNLIVYAPMLAAWTLWRREDAWTRAAARNRLVLQRRALAAVR